MKFESVTIRDIAKALSVSTSTVSRALGSGLEINLQTKATILEYAKRVNYIPNPSALNLKERRNRTIGIVVSEVANSFFSQVIDGIESLAKQNGYRVIIAQTLESYTREVNAISKLSQSVDGLLISLSSETTNMEHIHQLHHRGMPIVFFDRIDTSIPTHHVISNNYKACFDATTHLIDKGYQRIAFIGNTPCLSISIEREAGYTSALEAKGIRVSKSLIKHCPHGEMNYPKVKKVLDILFQLKTPPDAIVSCSDRITTHCFKYCKSEGISLPGQMGLIGFSNQDLTEFMNPPLSTITQDASEIGRISAELLIQQIDSPTKPESYQSIVVDTQIIYRGSCR